MILPVVVATGCHRINTYVARRRLFLFVVHLEIMVQLALSA